jgi:transposase|tara:strand:+ start:94 stop:603 length:510 start_codon:yes stop_codon:yes gene_type:complete
MGAAKTIQRTDWREARRIRGWELSQKGWSQKHISEALGVTKGAVSQWIKRAKEGGVEALKATKATGAPRRLTPDQRAQIPGLLSRGAQSFGFRGDVWTCGRIATVIEQTFGVSYHPSHVSRILRDIGYSLQKPVRRATQRDEDAIVKWKDDKWPEIKKSPEGRSNHSIR